MSYQESKKDFKIQDAKYGGADDNGRLIALALIVLAEAVDEGIEKIRHELCMKRK